MNGSARTQMKVHLAIVLLLIGAVLISGCGTVVTSSDIDKEGSKHGLVYGGTRADLRAVSDPDYMQHVPLGKSLAALDVPLSAVADTIALPVTLAIEQSRSSATDARLVGTWHSDGERALADYHRIYDHYNLSQEWTIKNTNNFGKRVITFSDHQVSISLAEEHRLYAFSVVSRTADRVVLRLTPLPSGREELFQMDFSQDGGWSTSDLAPFGDFFKR